MQNKIAINFLSWIIFRGKEIAFMDNMQIRWITYWIAPYFIESMNGTDRKLKCSMYLTGVRAFAYPQSFTPLSLSLFLPPFLPLSLFLLSLTHQSPYIHLKLQSDRVGVIDWTIHSYQSSASTFSFFVTDYLRTLRTFDCSSGI